MYSEIPKKAQNKGFKFFLTILGFWPSGCVVLQCRLRHLRWHLLLVWPILIGFGWFHAKTYKNRGYVAS